MFGEKNKRVLGLLTKEGCSEARQVCPRLQNISYNMRTCYHFSPEGASFQLSGVVWSGIAL